MNAMAFAAALLLLAQGDSGEADRLAQLDRACSLVQRAYPMLMLAAMAEGGMNCGDPDSGEFIDCDADDTPEQRARQAQRLEIRQNQEAAFKQASDACDAWAQDRRSLDRQLAVTRTYLAARAVGTDLPPEVMD
jgi:uncharacterized protein (DUF2126 family)